MREAVPNVDDPIVDYLLGWLAEPQNEDEDIPVHDFVGPMLVDAGGNTAAVNALCQELSKMFDYHGLAKEQKSSGLTKLETPIHMLSQSHISATAKLAARNIDLEAVSGRKIASQVDQKKLEKAEKKIREKLLKRERKSNYEGSKLLVKQEEVELLAINPILDYTTTRGKSKDIKLDNFDISFAGKRILTDASLTIAFGRRYGLIGRNGIGKSTLLRTISRREVNIPTHVSILHVEQEMVGDDTPAIESVLKADYFREHLLQEERKLTARMTELEQSTETNNDEIENEKGEIELKLRGVYSKLNDIESDKAEARAAAILSGLGFRTEQIRNPTSSFSGGWRMRLSLARALFCKPDLLLLDEPTNMLDIPAVVWLESYLKTWPNSLLVVSHDREFLDEVATDILHQHSEKLDYYKGNFTQFYATKEERRKNQLREYESQMQYRQHLQDFIDRWRYNANRAAQAQMKIKILEKLPELEKPEDETIVTFSFPETEKLSPPILQMDEVTFGYGDGRTILGGISFDMQMDSRIAVVGPNGAGKSTMLKLLTGQLEPRTGMVHRHGRLRLAYFTQHHVDQLDLNLSPVGYMAKAFPGRTEEEYRRYLGRFGISGMVGLQPIQTLSGGQKSRVAFACLAIQDPHFLVLDEPTNHLDMDSIDALTNALKQFTGGVAVVSHDERFIDSVCNEIWVCDNAKLTKFTGEGIKDYKRIICPEGNF
ncbi:P-loop containing nucleoside triphosphate hydrolase protein [Basidiobolus meristosporus CBS 931.73]|uniref:p-loop containing nucleoside triphosphate hydrolase protein n=1 Tax=Basidiobolus meristosporus CBS 931.73 TaxID=1314790 RepID=A0A1Y1Z3E1_9FUNG|nr:P-loop containing nucleoside triphosphate hydrolase protein [Basidiobolus meristosporus CBS 931.73]|eukprot:ORY04634.1 P-loop containing nucleoside triphosphate hydrolase protein [Basidiobolus meristosporus CBS 931.73]